MLSPLLPTARPLAEGGLFHVLEQNEILLPALFCYFVHPHHLGDAGIVESLALLAADDPLRLHRDPEPEHRLVLGPEPELVVRVAGRLGGKAEGGQRIVDSAAAFFLLRLPDAQLAARQQARGLA
jgi:hypothetical protein